MSSLAQDSGDLRENREAAVMRIATESRAMLGLVEGCPEFERLASILERARSEAVRILNMHGLSLPPALTSQGEAMLGEAADRKGSPET